MGTHPIFESDFDCLTDNDMENEKLVIKCRVCQTVVEPDHFDIHQKCDTCHSRTCGHENESCRPIEAKKEKLIGCGKCSYSCSTMTQLKYHFLVHQKASLRCPLCPDFVAHQMQSLKRHQRQVHGSIEVLKCKECDYETKRKDNLSRHIKTKHSSGGVEFVCETCGIKCKSLTSLKKHKKSHTEGPFTCKFCHRQFKFQNTLTTHVNTNHRQGLLTKSCVFCSKQFSYAEQSKLNQRLERHLSNHRRMFQKMKFKCQFCIFGADNEADISKHVCHRDEISDISGVQITEPTSVIAENPLFKILPTAVLRDSVIVQQDPCPIPSELKTADFDDFDEFYQTNDLIGQNSRSSVIVSSLNKKHESVIVSPPHSLFYPSV